MIRRGADHLSVFVATLGWSREAYVEFVIDERVETLIGAHENAFLAFGGVPREVLYDNMRTSAFVLRSLSWRACMSDLQHERIAGLRAELRLGAVPGLYGGLAQGAVARETSFAGFLKEVLPGERDHRRAKAREMFARVAGLLG